MIALVPVSQDPRAVRFLYVLLAERTPEQSISHKAMPTFEEHEAFVRSNPYQAWYLIHNEARGFVGSIYLTDRREVGLFICRADQGRGYATDALKALRVKHPGPLLANVNPANKPSIRFWLKRGGRHIQNTYEVP